MPTRKEILESLEGRIGELSDSVNDSGRRYDDAADRFAENANNLADSNARLGDALGKVADSLVGGAAIFLGGAALGGLTKMLVDRALEIRRKSQLIDSLISLQKTHGALTYEFAVERSFAEGTVSETRRTIVNELIYDGIVQEDTSGGSTRLWIDEEGQALRDYWSFVDGIQQRLMKISEKK